MNITKFVNDISKKVAYEGFKSKGGLYYELKNDNYLLNAFSFYTVNTHLYVCDFMMPTFVPQEVISFDFGELLSSSANRTGNLFKCDTFTEIENSKRLIIDVLREKSHIKPAQDLKSLYSLLSGSDRYKKGIHYFRAFISTNLLIGSQSAIEDSFDEYYFFWNEAKPDRDWEKSIHSDILLLHEEYKRGNHLNVLSEIRYKTIIKFGL